MQVADPQPKAAEPVLLDRHGAVAVLTINRPDRRNAVNGAVAQALEAALDTVDDDPALRVAILTGAGTTFCAGADLSLVASGTSAEMSTERGGFAGLVGRPRRKPLIAAVNGPALAGGCEVALACDLIVASSAARFGLPEVRRGIVAAAGGLFRLARKVPQNVAMHAILTGEPIDVATAHRHGLVTVLAEPGAELDAALDLARTIAANAPLAVAASRAVVHAAFDDEGPGWAACADAAAQVMDSYDVREGARAFLEKRDPVWEGR